MKREGRQHGMVRTYQILPDTDGSINHSTPRFINQIHTQPTAGVFTKVSSKPTNHSKSTGLSNSNNNKSKRRRNNHKDNEFIFSDAVRFSGVSASGVLNSLFYQDQEKSCGGALDHYECETLEDYGKAEGEGGDDIVVVDEAGGTVTIGEMVMLLEQINDEDWCFVGVDA